MFLSVYSKNQPHENLSLYKVRKIGECQIAATDLNPHDKQQKKASDAFYVFG